MDRRSFIRGLALSASGIYVSTKAIFLPPSGGWPQFGASVIERADVRSAQATLSKMYRWILDQNKEAMDQLAMDQLLYGNAVSEVVNVGGTPRVIRHDPVKHFAGLQPQPDLI